MRLYFCLFTQDEESWSSLVQTLSENEHLIQDDQQKDEQTTQEGNAEQYLEVHHRCVRVVL